MIAHTPDLTISHKIVIMRDGILEQAGSPEELYDLPANTFVAGFIGSPAMNLLQGFGRADDTFATLLDGPKIGHRISGVQNADVIIGIRPEHVEIVEDGEGISALVNNVELTGSETLLTVHVGPHIVLASVRQRQHLKPGDEIRLRVAPEHVLLFDAQTTERIG